jgi:hypothetical protein
MFAICILANHRNGLDGTVVNRPRKSWVTLTQIECEVLVDTMGRPIQDRHTQFKAFEDHAGCSKYRVQGLRFEHD